MEVFHVAILLSAVYLCFWLLQRYLRGRSGDEEGDETNTPRTTTSTHPAETSHRSRNRGATGPSAVTCPVCGTENDSYYTFCKNCVTELPSPGPSEPMGTQPL